MTSTCNGETWSRGTIDVNVMLNLSNKRRGLGIFPGNYERGPPVTFFEKQKKTKKTKEVPVFFISRLLVVFTWQLEIFKVTQLYLETHGVQEHMLGSCSLLL